MVPLTFFLLIFKVSSQSTTDACAASLYPGYAQYNWRSTWSDVPESSWGYDFNEEVALGETTTPCGFRGGEIQEDNNPGFCLKVNQVADHNVQLLIESEEPGVRMCVKTKAPEGAIVTAGALEPLCAEDRIRACFPAESSFFAKGAPLEFYITATPATAALSFWYKVSHSLNRNDKKIYNDSAISNVDMWCSMIEGTKDTFWPETCMPKDEVLPPPEVPVGGDLLNSAYSIVPYFLYVVAFGTFLCY